MRLQLRCNGCARPVPRGGVPVMTAVAQPAGAAESSDTQEENVQILVPPHGPSAAGAS